MPLKTVRIKQEDESETEFITAKIEFGVHAVEQSSLVKKEPVWNQDEGEACSEPGIHIELLPSPLKDSEISSDYTVAAYVDLKGSGARKVLICSVYLPGDKQDPTEELSKVVEYAQAQKAELIVGCDANAHHTIWESTGFNKRGYNVTVDIEYVKEEVKDHEEGSSCDAVEDPIGPETLQNSQHVKSAASDVGLDHNGNHVCPICCTVFHNAFSLSTHIRVHREANSEKQFPYQTISTHDRDRRNSGDKPFPCELCNKQFTNKSNLNAHKRIHTDGTFDCDVCSKRFMRRNHLESHKRVHTRDKPFPCKLCGKQFTNKSNLNAHARIHTDRTFKCDICDKKFTHKKNFESHKLVHTGDKPFPCKWCDKLFTNKGNLNAHERIHTDRTFDCDICEKRFTHRKHLEAHKLVHTGEKNFLCKWCNKQFTSKSNLNAHARIHTDRTFDCDMCDKKFTHRNHLESHKRLHTGEKPFGCDICHKQFSQKPHLKAHLRTHTGEKPYGCKTCNKRFIKANDLRRHERIHTGERPYSCELCKKRFVQKRHLTL